MAVMTRTPAFASPLGASAIRALPKVELHLHIEGTLEPELAFALAERNGVTLPYSSPEELRAAYDFTDLQSFLDVYYATMAVLRTADDFRDLTVAYLDRAAAQGLAHVELFFDPQAHLIRGVAFADVIDGIERGLAEGLARHDVTGGMILCLLRDRPVAEALEVIEQAAAVSHRLLGIGLDSAEVGYPPALFAPVYDRARELGLKLVAHAGEEAPPAYIWEALDVLGVARIDHGVQAVNDPALLERLAAERIPLTVCPFSNVRLKVVPELAAHPLPALLAAGVVATVNSDDPSYFGGYVGDNYQGLAEAFGYGVDALALLARNGVEASFASVERKTEVSAAIDAWVAEHAEAGA